MLHKLREKGMKDDNVLVPCFFNSLPLGTVSVINQVLTLLCNSDIHCHAHHLSSYNLYVIILNIISMTVTPI